MKRLQKIDDVILRYIVLNLKNKVGFNEKDLEKIPYIRAIKDIKEGLLILIISMLIFISEILWLFNPHSSADKIILIGFFSFIWIMSIIRIQTTLNALAKQYKQKEE